jgi:hypothetical protein
MVAYDRRSRLSDWALGLTAACILLGVGSLIVPQTAGLFSHVATGLVFLAVGLISGFLLLTKGRRLRVKAEALLSTQCSGTKFVGITHNPWNEASGRIAPGQHAFYFANEAFARSFGQMNKTPLLTIPKSHIVWPGNLNGIYPR